ncbi:bifunctional 4-hydroxy-3-methylbut-2-enyl diphosphate reductase/30S ribosomal protein S1 [Candidatus Contubernalis alkaliaceticus]|uniref:bifunctional 4-hydroxy-3-methylbut-2-enyl diphosphate reductase/30S ribosomal protein S1 n=1 Tax=Candidatus Contubernalis alkaliaceticus TaxID=338645 RepID=UPI001F4C2141|nr:bifunctional 4-hydroxy-3-methylbut-2-enyl diphosphate reductase/30S ribosomal protein S1 [Candidatus Contubernalis alkalaceticus]UNC92481.1 bifunctional 4-hydroxy-3-methylbut-2-enyl diphosphate reductase/30S ribosomal protein S1 [Candidatus Contubernalis alkalaceticus]
MKIKFAEHAGFCIGVERALKMALEKADEGDIIFTLGPLVHNQQVVDFLKQRNINYVDTLGEIEEGTVIFRSHGVPPEVVKEAEDKSLRIIDATCPFVKKVQDKVSHLADQGYQIIIVGDPEHPEVKGLIGWSKGQAVVIDDINKVKELSHREKIAVVSQTTLGEEYFNRVVEEIKKYSPGLHIFKTICRATGLRQKAAVKLAEQVNLMIVIGGYTSSNTSKLAAACNMTGTPTYHIEKAIDLQKDWLDNINVVGVTAGASTPICSLKEVYSRMSEFMKENDEKEVQEEEILKEDKIEGEAEEAVTEEEQVVENIQIEQDETEVNAAEKEDVSFKKDGEELSADDYSSSIPKKGSTIQGKVIQVTESEVNIDLNLKNDGVIPRNEVSLNEGESLQELFQVGDELELYVLKVPMADEDRVILSKKRFDREKLWNDLEKAHEEGNDMTARVSEVVKGGLILDLGIRAFLPASLVDLRYVPDLQQFVGEEMKVRVIELNRSKNKVVVSRKKVLEQELEETKKETLGQISQGEVIKGEVRRLTDFGAFVDVGGIDGLVHISEISWQRIEHPSVELEVGQFVDVKVLSINPEEERISLSIKQAKPDPWTVVNNNFTKGELVTGPIKCVVDFGVFVEIMPGVEGLVHISQLSEEHVTHPNEVVSEGQELTVRILDINPSDKRISLSLREAKKEKVQKEKPRVTQPKEEEDPKGTGFTMGEVMDLGDFFDNAKTEEE